MSHFTLFRVAGVFGGLYSCMSRRGEEEKTKSFFGVSPSRKRFDRFSIVECFGFLLEGISGCLMVMLEEFRKETLWCESRKTDLHGKRNAGIVD